MDGILVDKMGLEDGSSEAVVGPLRSTWLGRHSYGRFSASDLWVSD